MLPPTSEPELFHTCAVKPVLDIPAADAVSAVPVVIAVQTTFGSE